MSIVFQSGRSNRVVQKSIGLLIQIRLNTGFRHFMRKHPFEVGPGYELLCSEPVGST
jgi:hypothetical protein